MRVTTYTERSVPVRGSVFALGILLLTIALGTGVVPTVAGFVGGVFPELITPSWLVLYLGAFLGLMFTHGINWISWLVRYRLLFVLLLIGAVISVSWSIDAQVSAERTVHLVGSSLVAVFIGFTIPLLVTLRVFAIVLGLSLIASIVVALGLPALGIQEYEGSLAWRGVFNSKNDLGFWAGAGLLLYVTLSESSQSIAAKTLCYLMAVMCIVVLTISQSATSLLATLVAGALLLYLYIASRFRLGFFRMAIVAIFLTALTALAITNIETTEWVGRSGDLTGRGEVWRQVLNLIYEYPLTGVGYGTLWFPTDNTIWIQQSLFDFTWTVFHAHNGLLQLASEIGIPVAMIALLMVAQQLIEIFYCQYERQQVGVLFVLGFVVAFLVSNFSEARFLVTRELFWIFFIALPIRMLRQINIIIPDASVTADQDDPTPHRKPAYATDNSIHARPWLAPIPSAIKETGVAATATAATSAKVEVAANQPENIDESESNDELDLTMVTLSLTQADIDVGSVIIDMDENDQVSGFSREIKKIDDVVLRERADKKPKARQPETFDNDDTFDTDRYDIDLEIDVSEMDR